MRVATLLMAAAMSAAPGSGPAAVGASAPALPATALDGSPIAKEAVPGKVTVLNFWATWCPPCRAETPDYAAAYRKLRAKDVAFLGIDTTETAPIVKTFVSAKGIPYPIALAGPDLYNAYGISYIPTTIVLDAKGVVRARWIGGVTPSQLAQYVADARAGRSSTYVSRTQREIDAILAPQVYHLDGSARARVAADTAVTAAVAKADALAYAHLRDSDFERTSREEGSLVLALGHAESDAAQTPAEHLEALRTLASGYGDLNDWADAANTDTDALALSPTDPQLVDALSHAYYRLHDYDAMIVQAERYTQLAPDDGDGWSTLGLAYQRARKYADAAKAYATSLTLLEAAATKATDEDPIVDVADTALDAANVYVSLGDAANAHRIFDLANAYTDGLQPHVKNAEFVNNVRERTQEGLVAVTLVGGTRVPIASITPWTGADLPGSLASTLKYRLIVAGPPDASVTLHVRGLANTWVASFCADGLCSPQTVTFAVPSTGVKTYEFQLVPPHEGAKPGNVAVSVDGGAVVPVPESATTTVSSTR
jgi:cytochrome c biogenesis protein CcmG/thiol:disulfide interchange protein DsbE